MTLDQQNSVTAKLTALWPTANHEQVALVDGRIGDMDFQEVANAIEHHRIYNEFLNPTKLLEPLLAKYTSDAAAERAAAERDRALHRANDRDCSAAQVEADWKRIGERFAVLSDQRLEELRAAAMEVYPTLAPTLRKADPRRSRLFQSLTLNRVCA